MTDVRVAERPRRYGRIEHPADRAVETRHQTGQKLDLWDRYPSGWASIIAKATNVGFCQRDLWIIDAMGGEGRHTSGAHPDGALPGTVILAARAAQKVQLAHRSVQVHVRATEIDAEYAKRLRLRVERYRGTPPERVDVDVFPDAFADRRDEILAAIRRHDHAHSGGRLGAHRHRSLWLLDPYGVEEIPHVDLQNLGDGSEVVVNLNVAGIWRLVGQALSVRVAAESAEADAALLDRLFGARTSWVEAARGSTTPEVYKKLARAYADTFRQYGDRNIYPLHASGSEYRYLVHLTNSKIAVGAFKDAYDRSLTVGTLHANKKLNLTQKRIAVEDLWTRFKGTTISIREMREEAGVIYDGTQLRAICGSGEADEFCHFDPGTGIVEWFPERRKLPDLTLGL